MLTARKARRGGRSGGAAELDDLYTSSQWKLIVIRFRKHKPAVVSLFVLALFYLLALLAPFFSVHDPNEKNADYREAPPQGIYFLDHAGNFSLFPVTYPFAKAMDTETFEVVFSNITEKKTRLKLFAKGFEYRLLGLTFKRHFIGTGDPDVPFHMLGCDSLGRDLFSRILYGSRISLSIGLFGVAISFFLGILIGGIAGYLGGAVDNVVQRAIEILLSIPQLPLWMALSAALPRDWSQLQNYLLITIILSIIGWTGLARIVRGRFLSLRTEDFVTAAELMGRNNLQIIFIHMLPSFYSYIIASLTLSIPGMILGETALSFLGLGLQAPTISWGVLLQDAQNVYAIAITPWILLPCVCVIIVVLAFNLLGDGLRDAADPYGSR